MAKLSYVTIMSLDGYIGDGHYDWGGPIEGSMTLITNVMRPFGTYLYGRKNYETMSFWENPPNIEKMGSDDQEFGRVWQAAEKIVYSKTLKVVTSKKARIESNFEAQKIREMKTNLANDICIGGPTLAGQAIHAGLVDEVQLLIVPVTIGNSFPTIPVLPKDITLKLDLLEYQTFGKGWLYLRYRIQN